MKIRFRTSTIAIAMMLTIAATIITIAPVASQKISTFAFVAASPDIVGVGQNVVISMWITPPPPWSGDWAEDPIPYEGYMVTITKPDTTTDNFGPYTSFGSGSQYLVYTPTSLGTYTVTFNWAGDETHNSAEAQNTFTVQQEQVPPYPSAELPTDYWERPINVENREWSEIGGNWLTSSWSLPYNASIGCYNPYSKAPNTAHILWRKPVGMAGIIGGEYRSQAANRREDQPFHDIYPVVMLGRVYYPYLGEIHCLDLSTGEELWVVPGSGTLYGQPGPDPTLWALGDDYVNYDAFSGIVRRTISDVPAWASGGGTFVIEEISAELLESPTAGAHIYIANMRINITKYYLGGSEWDSFEDNIEWSTDWPTQSMRLGSAFVWGDRVCTGSFLYPGDGIMGLDADTGAILWDNQYDFSTPGYETLGYGKFYSVGSDLRVHAWDLDTGAIVWESDPMDYPWGDFNSYSNGVAYGKVYVLSYDGHVYAFDADNGDLVWKTFSGETTETSTGQWGFWTNPAIADGKIYASTGLHSTGGTIPRGDKLYCMNADNGDIIWSLPFTVITDSGTKAIADGKLIAINAYDGFMYCFDKGKSETTVKTAGYVAKGEETWISGTVMDMSPAQPGTPCVSSNIMSEYMAYLHMQRPAPDYGTGTGVLVKLIAEDTDGTIINIGETTSSCDGVYAFKWTPQEEDFYKISAIFEGDDAYWGSYAIEGLAVGPEISPGGPIEPEPTEAPTPEPTEPPLISTEVAIIAAVAVVAVIGVVAYWALRRRQ